MFHDTDTENGVLNLNQKTFVETLAQRFDVTTTACYPASPSANLGPRMKGESGGTWPYREAVDSLTWVVVWSKPEIYNSTRVVARHVDDPSKRHRQAVLRIIKYALGTKDQSLTFERGPNLNLSVYTYVNYAEKADDRRSVSGVAVTVGNSTESWSRSTQKIETLSTTEAEYVALRDGVKEGLFVKAVLSFIVPSFGEEHHGVVRQRRGYRTSSKPP